MRRSPFVFILITGIVVDQSMCLIYYEKSPAKAEFVGEINEKFHLSTLFIRQQYHV